MQRIALLSGADGAALFSRLAHAQPWFGEAALGLLITSGNNETRSINGKFTLDYRYKISETNLFRQQLKAEAGEANLFAQSISELKLSVVGNLFASFTFTVQNNSYVADDVKPTDSTTAVNLSYAFGKQPG